MRGRGEGEGEKWGKRVRKVSGREMQSRATRVKRAKKWARKRRRDERERGLGIV